MSHGELASILRSRAAPVNDADVEATLRDPESGSDLAEWAKLHLTADTLLTLDELELYDALQRSGRDEELAAAAADTGGGDDGRAAVPLTDAELRTAIEALDRSTEAISKQTDVLRLQQDAVARLVTTTDQGHRDTRAAFEARHLQRWDTNRTNLVAEVERLSRVMDDRVGDLAQQNKELAHRVQQTVDGLCRSDDTLLASLQKLGWALPVTGGGGGNEDDEAERQQQKSIGRLRDICLHLIKFTVETIRTKLERLYLEALEAGMRGSNNKGNNSNTAAAETADVAALQEELESLYSEILPVAQMSVEQQYLEPALKALSGKNGKNMARSLLALDYIDECLEFLLEHIALLSARIETATAHHAAADSLIAATRSELAVQVSAGRKKDDRRRLSNYGSPTHRRQSSGSSPMRTRSGTGGGIKAHRRRSSGFGSGLANIPPLDQLLEGLSLLLPMQDEISDNFYTAGAEGGTGNAASAAAAATTATVINTKFLQSTLADRSAKADGVASNAQEAFEVATATQLADARRAVRMARESVLAESPFGAVQLVDPEIDASIAVMAQEVGRLRVRLGDVDQDLDKVRRGRSAKREQIIARWGG